LLPSCLQVSLPEWPGRLPPRLTQLVLSPLTSSAAEAAARAGSCTTFFGLRLMALRRLRHLAFHGLHEIHGGALRDLGAAAAALRHLISLHLVRF
jgi:hypothetical protein